MKRGKDDEKLVRPMFPRLHVNDTEKGGPRAPPRNKMALYEQFSIPSQRSNPGVQPLNPVGSSNTISLASSSQETAPERNYILPVPLPPQTPTYQVVNSISHQSDTANPNCSMVKPEQRNKGDEDDFRVPIYINSRVGQSSDKTQKTFDGKKFTSIGVEVQNDCDADPKLLGLPYVNIRKHMRFESNVLANESPSRDQPVKSARNTLNGENIDCVARQDNLTPNPEHPHYPGSRLGRLHQADACLQQDHEAGPLSNDTRNVDGLVNPSSDIDRGDVPLPRGCFHSTADQNSPVEAIDDTDCHNTRGTGPTQKNWDKSDIVSKISMVDNLLSQKISPDDAVEIIGQKHFWKARRAIVNQQRAFAVQVFELHRLIKVQQLIAGSPDILLEDGAFLGKSTLKGSAPNKHSLECVVKPRQQNLKCKDDSKKHNHKMECSAENAVGKTSLSSVKNGSHLSNYAPIFGNCHQVSNPWYLHQSAGHQWLIPVLSPSEGLVYKPCPGPGFTGTACGGYGHFGPGFLGGAFMNHAYGVPASHQGFGVPTDTPPSSHAYFPGYDMPVMTPAISGSAVEQKNQFAGPGSHGKNGRLSGKGDNCNSNSNAYNQSSCNLPPVQKSGTIAQSLVKKFQASKACELQGSTASSPGKMAQEISSTGQIVEGKDALPLFPMASPVFPEAEAERAPRSTLEIGQRTRAIKVVPHNPRSATESAARIFKSIQEERRRYDSV
ncbi:protein EARLY FLOWERING 3 [Prosopis cineraria]|uniref:protein EARLY FLOWERING 3 n=1 Tax=Prosopis cineraria TaxID=364024 RepID=UPI00240F1CBD|nr:protein EARLY FLOWERING 3 [Prosopis cineraria]